MLARDNNVPNTGSEARDHLANERTLNAWLRTALGLVGFGVALPKLVGPEPAAVAGAAALILVGCACLAYAGQRYLSVSRALLAGSFPVARRGPVVVAASVLLVAVGALVLVLAQL